MKVLRFLVYPLAASIVFTPAVRGANDKDFKKIAPKVAQTVGELLEKAHYSRRRLDDSVSRQLLKNYLELNDYDVTLERDGRLGLAAFQREKSCVKITGF